MAASPVPAADTLGAAPGVAPFEIAGRPVGPGHPAYMIAEVSANHNGRYEDAADLVKIAKDCGADAVKIQTYTADTLTLDVDRPEFRLSGGLWDGRTLHDLYEEAHTPWEWQPKLAEVAREIGLPLFSTPFDPTAVDFLETEVGVPAHKIASFELVDLPLIERVAATGKPIIMSTGLGTLAEISAAVDAVRAGRETAGAEGGPGLALLKCTSAYPAPASAANLRTIPHLAAAFGVPAGLSDHTLGIAVPVAAAALGACVIEKHFTRSRDAGGPDAAFSLEPAEFRAMVEAVRTAEQALGRVRYGGTDIERTGRSLRRSLYVTRPVAAGETFTHDNVRSIRPGHGLSPAFLPMVLGRTASRPLERGTPLTWESL